MPFGLLLLAAVAVTAFVVVPFFTARALSLVPLPWFVRLPVMTSIPALLLLYLFTAAGDITELATPFIAYLVLFGWVLGCWEAERGRHRHFANPS